MDYMDEMTTEELEQHFNELYEQSIINQLTEGGCYSTLSGTDIFCEQVVNI